LFASSEFNVLSVDRKDAVAVSVLRHYHASKLNLYKPIGVYGDGNSCYRAVAIRLFGSEVHHSYVRFLTAIEMLTNRNYYEVLSRKYCGLFRDSRIDTPNNDELIKITTTLASYVEMMHVYAISAAEVMWLTAHLQITKNNSSLITLVSTICALIH